MVSTHSLQLGAIILGLCASMCVRTQSLNAQYYNSDAGHPLRVEDAAPQPLRSIGLDLFTARAERVIGGTMRYRYEPSIDWGLFPQTEFGVRFPLIIIQPPRESGLTRTSGLAGIALGGLHAFTIETPHVPALAVASEVLLPIGSLAADGASFSVKAILTKRLGFGRVHFNVGGGTYSIRSASSGNASVPCDPTPRTRFGSPFQGTCDDPPIIVDSPCTKFADDESEIVVASSLLTEPSSDVRQSIARLQATTPTGTRARWSTGVGFDHAFALKSTSVGIDYFAEHFRGLYSLVDQTAELGIRTQTTPGTVMHAALSWHFAGVVQSFSVGAGVTMELAWPLVRRRAPQ